MSLVKAFGSAPSRITISIYLAICVLSDPMLQVGRYNHLKVLDNSATQVLLYDGEGGHIPLASREVTSAQSGDRLEVFVLYNSNGELEATTLKPYATAGEFAYLEVASLQSVGAFLNWGLPKELFLPFREQTRDLRVGDKICVFVYLDNSERISASMRIDKFISKTSGNYYEGDRVDLFIVHPTDLGYKAIINGEHAGVLYKDEVFQTLSPGQRLPGYIKFLRPDGKIDLSLQQTGYKGCEDIGETLLSLLEQNNGQLPLGDKSSAETIYELAGVSKKKFKMAVGTLYKQELISIDSNGKGIRLKSPSL